MATPTANELKQRLKALVLLSIAIPLLLLALPFLLVYGIIWWFWGYVLAHWCWRAHGRHGRDVLFVYSNSPNWEAYIEENILPRIRDRAVILNWSERKLWPQRCPWEARAFRYWAGSVEFNPVAIVLSRWKAIRVVRFYSAFRDYKHGNEQKLRAAESSLFEVLRDHTTLGA